jgi:CubicO group peptidase (beta-lactamase class C family)
MKLPSSIAFLFPAYCSFAQISEKLDPFFKEAGSKEPGMAFLIEQKGEIKYQKSVGFSNILTGETIDHATNFRMASVSKQFTAMGILLLEKDHKLSFEDPIGRFLPEIPAAIGQRVLIRHLLTHSAGLLDYESLIPPGQTIQVLDADVLRLLSQQDSTYFPPGTRFRYSNTGFCLLALIIERVSGQSFASFIKDSIFVPLHMNGSVEYEASSPITRRAMGYAKDSSGRFSFSDQSVTSATKGDGGVYTSLNDYRKWIQAIRENKLVDLKSILDRIRFPVNDKKKEFYGAGWFDIESPGHILFHSGSTCGFTNFVIWLPDEDWMIVYFSNIAENAQKFRNMLAALKDAGIVDFSHVLALYDLTL